MLNPTVLAALGSAGRLAHAYAGLTWRAIHLQHFPNFAAARTLFCPPGGVTGSRYVAPAGPAALYLALDADTAYRELNGWFYAMSRGRAGQALVRSGGLRPAPCVMAGVHVRLSRILDLTRPATRRRLRIRSAAELLGPWLGVADAPTQVLGAEAFADGRFEAMLYPSARNRGHVCLVLFPDRLRPTSRVHFHDAVTGIAAQLL